MAKPALFNCESYASSPLGRFILPAILGIASLVFVWWDISGLESSLRMSIGCALSVFVAVGVFALARWGKALSVEGVFALCYVLLGLYAAFAFLPFSDMDGTEHYTRAFEIAQGEFVSHKASDDSELYAMLPAGALPDGYEFGKNSYMTYGDLASTLDATIDFSQTRSYSVYTQAMYSPVAFLPSVIGIKLACLFTNSTWVVIYASRFFNWLIVGLILFFSLKTLPVGKNLAALIALVPVFIELYSSNSPDGFMLALCLALIAVVLHHRFDEGAVYTGRTTALLVLIVFGIALGKIVYLPLAALLFLLPDKAFSRRAMKYAVVGAIIVAASVVDVLWTRAAFSQFIQFVPDQNGSEQIAYLLSNPFALAAATATAFTQEGTMWISGIIGTSFYLWSNDTSYIISNVTFWLYLALVLAVCLFDNDIKKVAFTPRIRVFFLVLVAIIDALIFVSEYLQWTPVGAAKLEGVQGRYFAQMLLLFLLAIKPPRMRVANSGLRLQNAWILVFCLDACLITTVLIAVV